MTAPRVSITAPANETAVNGTVMVTASATDDVSVTKVELFADGALQSAVTAPPYTRTQPMFHGTGNVPATMILMAPRRIAADFHGRRPEEAETAGGAAERSGGDDRR